ncbi:MAG: type II toxin-antitoxin system RelE/ParE family toxin [Cyclobacteriaceae bacterium]|nr:type II toxin-antitoxin system RelE/ParE family toxin [Cyclobacteriaceae bacterium]
MNFEVELTEHFKKEARKLTKKYRSLKTELEALGEELAKNPTTGTPLGHDVYKVRLSIASKGKGKSGGARVITFVKVVKEKVYLVSIYDKSQLDNLTKEQILELMKKAGLL